jgi:galactokinase
LETLSYDHNTDDEGSRAEELRAAFAANFGGVPDFLSRAPGRVNLIGEHTDYNGGFVLPATIDRTVLVAARAVPGSREIDIQSENYRSRTIFSLDEIEATREKDLGWSNYIRAVLWALEREGHIDLMTMPGAQMAIEGNVPTGSGLSSSAAVEVSSALAFLRLAGKSISGVAVARACQRAENEFVGVKSGIMDQFISALGEPDSALLIDTRSLSYRVVPLGLEEIDYKLVAVDSAVPRSLITSAYNQRRAECEEAAHILAGILGLGRGTQLRDISVEQLEANRDALPEVLYRRARHVITEDARTLEAVNLMEVGLGNEDNMRRFGELLYASHTSLRDDYEVSSNELDLLVDLARQVEGVAGARMTGAGFGGCTVNIVISASLAYFQEQVVEEYRRRTVLPAKMYVCRVVQGGSYVE